MSLCGELNSLVEGEGGFTQNIGVVEVGKAYDFVKAELERHGKDIDSEFPDFRRNYKLLQDLIRQAPNFPRAIMPVIEPSNIKEFQKALKSGSIDIFKPYVFGSAHFPQDLLQRSEEVRQGFLRLGLRDGDLRDDKVPAKKMKIVGKNLKPTQNQIWLDKIAPLMGQFGAAKKGSPLLKTTIIVSKEGFILDGHHRFAQVMLADPDLKFDALFVPLDIDTLLKVGRSFGNAIGNQQKESLREGRDLTGKRFGDWVVTRHGVDVVDAGFFASAKLVNQKTYDSFLVQHDGALRSPQYWVSVNRRTIQDKSLQKVIKQAIKVIGNQQKESLMERFKASTLNNAPKHMGRIELGATAEKFIKSVRDNVVAGSPPARKFIRKVSDQWADFLDYLVDKAPVDGVSGKELEFIKQEREAWYLLTKHAMGLDKSQILWVLSQFQRRSFTASVVSSLKKILKESLKESAMFAVTFRTKKDDKNEKPERALYKVLDDAKKWLSDVEKGGGAGFISQDGKVIKESFHEDRDSFWKDVKKLDKKFAARVDKDGIDPKSKKASDLWHKEFKSQFQKLKSVHGIAESLGGQLSKLTQEGPVNEKAYYYLIGVDKETGKGELIFGDYDKETVSDEKSDVSDDYRKMKIVKSTDSASDEKKAMAQAKSMGEAVINEKKGKSNPIGVSGLVFKETRKDAEIWHIPDSMSHSGIKDFISKNKYKEHPNGGVWTKGKLEIGIYWDSIDKTGEVIFRGFSKKKESLEKTGPFILCERLNQLTEESTMSEENTEQQDPQDESQEQIPAPSGNICEQLNQLVEDTAIPEEEEESEEDEEGEEDQDESREPTLTEQLDAML